jgi:hypothetical protein
MRKILAILMAAVVFTACQKETVTTSESVKTKKAARLVNNEKVKLLKASTNGAFYSRSYIREKTFYVEVANIGFVKQVIVRHKMTDGSWKDFNLSYLKPADANTEIWYYEINYGVGTPQAANFAQNAFLDEFAIKYVVNGQEYWDNNNGKNYNIFNYTATDGLYMQDGLHVSADTYRSKFICGGNKNNLQVFADLRNIAFKKEVTLVYTTDNWATVLRAPFSFANTYAFGGDNFFINPSARNFEKWVVNLSTPRTISSVQYAISYKVNGVEYWDNNYTRNYTIKARY